jgi:hypothetical protein
MAEILFSHRLLIARRCAEWCAKNGINETPFNIITAAIDLGLLQVPFVFNLNDTATLYENFPKFGESFDVFHDNLKRKEVKL